MDRTLEGNRDSTEIAKGDARLGTGSDGHSETDLSHSRTQGQGRGAEGPD